MIGNRIRNFRKYKKLTLAQLSDEIGISLNSLASIETGKTKPSADTLKSLVDKTEISPGWLIAGRGRMVSDDDERIVTIQVLACSAISSYPWEGAPDVVETINVQRDLVDVGGRTLIHAVRYRGNSMQPTILNGSLVGIDFEDRKPLENSLFVVRFPGSGPIIKRIRFDVNGYLAVADNPTVPDLVVSQEMFRQEEIILGRVRWIYNKL